MKRFLGTLTILIITSPLGFCASTDMSSSSEPQHKQDFNLAGYGAKGQKTWEVQGAQMDMAGNDVKISDIKARLFGDKENMVLTADNGHFDKTSGVIHLQDHVKAVTESGAELLTDTLDWSQKESLITTNDKVNISRDNMTAVATGIEAKPDFKVAKFEKDVVMTIDGQKKTDTSTETAEKQTEKQKGAALPKSQMTVTCDGPMELNYEKQFAVFEKNVKVEGDAQQGTMVADKMTVYFSPTTKQIDKIDAQGHVKIERGENTSFSEGAIFTASDKRVVLTGRPKLVIFTEGEKNVSP